MAKKKKKEEKEESKQNVDEGSRPTLDNIYDDLGGEDLYNDFGDLTQSDINENNKFDNTSSKVAIDSNDTSSTMMMVSPADGNANESSSITANVNVNDKKNVGEKNIVSGVEDGDDDEGDKSSDSDSDDDEDVEIIIGDTTAASSRKLHRRSSFGSRVSGARNSWKRSDHIVNSDTTKDTNNNISEGTAPVDDGAATTDITGDELNQAEDNKGRRKSAFSAGNNVGGKILENDDGVEYDPLFAVEPWRLKTAFDIDINALEEKPWRAEGADISDFFNYGNDEEGWVKYAKEQDRVRRDLLYKDFLKFKKEEDEKRKKREEEALLNPPMPNACVVVGGTGSLTQAPGNNEQAGNSNFVNMEDRVCFKCKEKGHMSRDCPNLDRVQCYICKEFGHISKDCPKKGASDNSNNNMVCHCCGKVGHRASQCPEAECFKCGGRGHISKNCPNPPNSFRGGGGRRSPPSSFRGGGGRSGRPPPPPPPSNRYDRGGGNRWGNKGGGRDDRYNNKDNYRSRSRGGRDDYYNNKNYRSNSRSRGGNNYRSNSRNPPGEDDRRGPSRGRGGWGNNNNYRKSSRSRSPPERRDGRRR